jgi:hypothetical protein
LRTPQIRRSATPRTLGRIDESIATLEPVCVERFEQDIAKDTATERQLIVKAWVIAIGVCFLLLLRRLFE